MDLIEKYLNEGDSAISLMLYDIIYDQIFVDNDKNTRSELENIFNMKFKKIEDIFKLVWEKYRKSPAKIRADEFLKAFNNAGWTDNIRKHQNTIEKMYY